MPDEHGASQPSKIYQLDAASIAPPSPGRYWALRKQIEATRDNRCIFQITQRVLGRVPKASEMSPDQLAKMIHVFESMLRKTAAGHRPALPDRGSASRSADNHFPPPAMLPSPDVETANVATMGDDRTEPTPSASEETSGTARARRVATETARPHETPAAEIYSDRQQSVAGERRILLQRAEQLLSAGLTQSATAQALGISSAALSRLVNLDKRKGNTLQKIRRLILLPVEQLSPPARKTKTSPFEALLKLPDVVAELNRLYVATMGASSDQATRDRRTGSIATALKRLGDFPAVAEPLAAHLRAGQKPICLREFLKKSWTPEIEAKLRGQKHYASATVSGRRDLVEEDAEGNLSSLKPGRVWVLDDMSSNIPFWFEIATGGNTPAGLSAMIARHGCAVGRQGLYAWDWASGAWLGLDLIGRLRDAYQASDILRFLRKLMSRYGIPEKIVIERGVWKARCISGWTADDDGGLVELQDGWDLPDMAGDETSRIAGGIRSLGVEVIYAYTPRGKPIEGEFNHHQRLVPTFLKPGEAVNIGRHAGEYEWAARQMRRAGAGVAHARELGFIHIDRLADVAWEAMLWEGRQPKARRPQPPLEMLATFLRASPLPQLSQQNLAVFLPEKRSGQIRGGVLTCQVDNEPIQFIHPETFAALGDGTKIEYAFDPAEPTLGAAVYGNRGYLCWADYLPAGPVISARDRSEDAGPQLLKRYKLAHRTAARLLDLTTLRTVKITEQRQMPAGAATPSSQDPDRRRGVAATPARTKDSVAEMFGG